MGFGALTYNLQSGASCIVLSSREFAEHMGSAAHLFYDESTNLQTTEADRT